MNFSIAALLIAVSTANASPKLRGSSKSGKMNEFTNPSDMDDECNPGNKLEARGGMSVMAIGALKQYEVDMAKVVHSKSKVRLPSTPITLGFYFPLLYSHHMHIASNTTPRPS